MCVDPGCIGSLGVFPPACGQERAELNGNTARGHQLIRTYLVVSSRCLPLFRVPKHELSLHVAVRGGILYRRALATSAENMLACLRPG